MRNILHDQIRTVYSISCILTETQFASKAVFAQKKLETYNRISCLMRETNVCLHSRIL